ncbi:MAG: flagellar motor switch protein FliN [Armatimonadota bacterium]|nr:flagellar motor switch protein FliN [Armatimonadota bacterium]
MPERAASEQPQEETQPDPGPEAEAERTDHASQPAVEEGVHRLDAESPATRPERREGGSQPDSSEQGEPWGNLHRMLDVPLTITVELGSTEMPLSEVLKLETGSVITINRLPGEPIDLLINGRVFARGEVVVVNDTFAYRITELIEDAEDTIAISETV